MKFKPSSLPLVVVSPELPPAVGLPALLEKWLRLLVRQRAFMQDMRRQVSDLRDETVLIMEGERQRLACLAGTHAHAYLEGMMGCLL